MMASDKQRSTPEYWEKRLRRMGLSMEAGTPRVPGSKGHVRILTYGHKVSALDFDGVRTYATAEDVEVNQEWPISL